MLRKLFSRKKQELELIKEEPEELVEEKTNEESEEVVDVEAEAEPEALEGAEELGKVVEEQPLKEEKKSFFKKLQDGLSKTRKSMLGKVDAILAGYGKVDEELLEELEEILITSDIGMHTTTNIIERLREKIKEQKITDANQVNEVLKTVLKEILNKDEEHKLIKGDAPLIILMTGVNGVGKTTSIAKIAYLFKQSGHKVLLAAGDTFRAAAIDQLQIWGERIGVNVISHQEGSDPAAVIFDAIQSAKAKNIDVLICDTAGRLHNKKNLMNELSKIIKIIEREYPEADKETLLVLDATTGQNAVQQAKLFKEATNISGIVLTKLDGTAKGGVILSIAEELDTPVKFIGVGEGMTDLQEFDPNDFVEALFT